METGIQCKLVLSDRPTDEILQERLADLVEQMNASTDPEARVEIHGRITRLRSMLGVGT